MWSNNDHPIPSRISKIHTIATKVIPRWLRHRNIFAGLGFIVVTILYNIHLVLKNITHNLKEAHSAVSYAFRAENTLSAVIGELCFLYILRTFGGTILQPSHPTHIHVESIFREIINACNVGLKLEHDKSMTVSGDSKIDDRVVKTNNGGDHMMLREEVFNRISYIYSPSHLAGLNWKLSVLDTRYAQASCILFARRVIVTTALLDYLCSKAEIAAVLGHEVC